MDPIKITTTSSSPSEREALYKLKTPGRVRRFLEVRAVLEAFLLLPSAPLLLSQKPGDGRQIMLLPGFGTGDRSTSPLRRYLDYLGYDALP